MGSLMQLVIPAVLESDVNLLPLWVVLMVMVMLLLCGVPVPA
jgi:hypothetical protein